MPICRYCDELQQKSPNNSGEDNVPIRGTLAGPSSRSRSTPTTAQNLFDRLGWDHECLDRGHSRFAHFNFKVCSLMSIDKQIQIITCFILCCVVGINKCPVTGRSKESHTAVRHIHCCNRRCSLPVEYSRPADNSYVMLPGRNRTNLIKMLKIKFYMY